MGDAGSRQPRWAYLALATLPFAVAGSFLAMGAGYVLDDWFLLANVHFDGIWSVGGAHGWQRPGAVPFWGLVFGTFDGRPLPGLLVMATANSLFAVSVAWMLRRVMPAYVAIAVAAVWVILPAHVAQEVWLSCVNIAWSQALAAVAILVGWRARRRLHHLVLAGVLLAVAVLAYEATLVVAMVAIVSLPWLSSRRLDWPFIGTGLVSTGGAMGWSATHWHPDKSVRPELASIGDVVPGNLGWPVAGAGTAGDVLTVIMLGVVGLALARLALPSLRHEDQAAEWMVMGGLLVMVLGTLPFALFVYQPLGAGDRVNGLSAVGGALVWVGAFLLLARLSRSVSAVLAVGLLASTLVIRLDLANIWHLAGTDSQAVVRGVVEEFPTPPDRIVIGPEPIDRSLVVAFVEPSSFTAALELAYGERGVEGDVAHSMREFMMVPADRRFDVRPVSKLDDIPQCGHLRPMRCSSRE